MSLLLYDDRCIPCETLVSCTRSINYLLLKEKKAAAIPPPFPFLRSFLVTCSDFRGLYFGSYTSTVDC
ncbi:hypothetical protein VNO80_22477 [Phaseolus coccineus]|uniref:Uncharacterized protein n=1 Tax=Phaseolus coccineus TaxID=3886 RepID=A0AAN9M826_PHACN